MEQQKKKGFSIRSKLILVVIPIVLVIIISFFALSRSEVLEVSKRELQAKSQAYTGEISSWTNRIFSELQIYLDTINEGHFKDDAAILKYMESSVNKNAAYSVGLYMGDDSGVYLDGSGWVPGDDWVLVERDWYVDGKDNDTLAFGEPYYDSMTGQVCVSASVRVDYDKAVRVLATDVYLDYVCGIVANICNQGEVEAFLVTKDSQTIIAHPTTEMMAVTLDAQSIDSIYGNIGNALREGKTGLIPVRGDNGKYYACLEAVDHTDWYLVTYVMESKVLSSLHQMEFYMFVIAVVAAVILIVLILRIMGKVVKPIEKMTNVISRIAEGDFSQNLEVKGNDEIARMSSNMQHFIVQMRSTISEISDTADWLNKQSEQNQKVSDSLMDSSKDQAQAMTLLGEMVDRLSAAAEEVSSQMENLAELIRQADTEAGTARKLMQESVAMSENGKQDMEDINKGMGNINASITTLSEQIARVGEATAQIESMVGIIMDIAEETNLLSLNASIEAARAGEAGRGFGVVAEQIGKLAMNSNTAADDIAKLTSEIRYTVDEAVSHMNDSVSEVQTNTKVVEDARATFDGLYEKVEDTSRRVNEMIALVKKIDNVAGEMEQITGSQVQATEQIAESARTLDEHTKTVTAGSDSVAENAKELKKESMELSGRMEKFKL